MKPQIFGQSFRFDELLFLIFLFLACLCSCKECLEALSTWTHSFYHTFPRLRTFSRALKVNVAQTRLLPRETFTGNAVCRIKER